MRAAVRELGPVDEGIREAVMRAEQEEEKSMTADEALDVIRHYFSRQEGDALGAISALEFALKELALLRPVHAAALDWLDEDSPEPEPVIDALVDATVRAEKLREVLRVAMRANRH